MHTYNNLSLLIRFIIKPNFLEIIPVEVFMNDGRIYQKGICLIDVLFHRNVCYYRKNCMLKDR